MAQHLNEVKHSLSKISMLCAVYTGFTECTWWTFRGINHRKTQTKLSAYSGPQQCLNAQVCLVTWWSCGQYVLALYGACGSHMVKSACGAYPVVLVSYVVTRSCWECALRNAVFRASWSCKMFKFSRRTCSFLKMLWILHWSHRNARCQYV